MWEKFKMAVRGPLAQKPSPEHVLLHQRCGALWNLRGIVLSISSCIASWALYLMVPSGALDMRWMLWVMMPAILLLPVYTYWAGAHRGIADQMEYDLAEKAK